MILVAHKNICQRRRNNVSTSDNADFKLRFKKRCTDHSSVLIFLIESFSYKNTLARCVHSRKLFQQLRTVNSRCQTRQKDQNPNSSVVAQTMKLLAISSYRHQIMDRSQHTVKKYVNDGKTHAAFYNKLFRKVNNVIFSFYGVEIAKAVIEHKQPIIVGFFVLQNSKLGMLDFYYNFFH